MQRAPAHQALHSQQILHGSANSKMPSLISKLQISYRRLKMSSAIWNAPIQWIASSAVMWVMARPRLQFVQHLRLFRMESKLPYLFRQRSLFSNIQRPLLNVMQDFPSRLQGYLALIAPKKPRQSWKRLSTAAPMSSSVHIACFHRMWSLKILALSSSMKSSALA